MRSCRTINHPFLPTAVISLTLIGCQAIPQTQGTEYSQLLDRLRGRWHAPILFISGSGPTFPCSIDWESPELNEVVRAGREIVPDLLRALEDKNSPSHFRVDILLALGLIRDKRVLEILVDRMENDSSKAVRCAAVRAIGLLGSPDAKEKIRNVFGKGRVPAKILLWSLAILGDAQAQAEYLEIARIESNYRPPSPSIEEMWSAKDISSPLKLRFEPNYALYHPDGNCKDLSLLRTTEALEVMIEYLRPDSPAGAAYFLQRIVKSPPMTTRTWSIKTPYEVWREWWERNKDRIKWSDDDGQFVIEE